MPVGLVPKPVTSCSDAAAAGEAGRATSPRMTAAAAAMLASSFFMVRSFGSVFGGGAVRTGRGRSAVRWDDAARGRRTGGIRWPRPAQRAVQAGEAGREAPPG